MLSLKVKGEAYQNFLLGFRSEATKESYVKKLNQFLVHARIDPDELLERAEENPRALEKLVLEYAEVRRSQVSGSTLSQLRDSLKHFYTMNDLENALNWRKLGKLMPRAKKSGGDRAPSIEEIRKIIEHADLRMRGVLQLLVSSGIRIGAVDHLRWVDLQSIRIDKESFASITAYRGENEQYPTFITPECFNTLLEYRRLRESEGETITPQSPLIRLRKWNRAAQGQKGEALCVSSKALRNEIGTLLRKAGLREPNQRLHEFKQVHGFRKFFRTRCENAGVSSMIVEMLMGHRVGLGSNYLKPTTDELARHYLKAIPYLTVSETYEVKHEVDKKVTERIAARDKKVVELERMGLELQDRLDKMEKQVQQIRALVEGLSTATKRSR